MQQYKYLFNISILLPAEQMFAALHGSIEYSDGAKSLQLEAKKHTACTSTVAVKVTENSKYLLSFDYQSPNAEQVLLFSV